MKRAVVGGLALISLTPLVLAWRRGSAARHLARWQHQPLPGRWPSVSIIVPAWREQGTLIACLDGLKNVEYDGDCKIIVVAGGPDGTLEVARSYAAGDPRAIQVLAQRTEGGKNGAVNDAAARAVGEILVLLDADTIVAPSWLQAMVAPLDDGYAASTGKFVPSRRTLVSRALEMSQMLEYEARGRVILQGSGSMAVRREAFDALGGLPEGGAFADDWDLSERLVAAGYRLAFAPEALCCTERPSTLREWWRNEVRWRRIHLISLFRVADTELSQPVKATKALYPYLAAWAALAASAAALLSFATRWRVRPIMGALWLMLVAPILSREIGGAVETAAYTGESNWLDMIFVVPVLTAVGWAAIALASLTTFKANVHYKGPRRAAHVAPPPAVSDPSQRAGTIEDVLIGAVG